MSSFLFVYFDEDTDYMCVFEDIAKTFVKIYDDDFKVDQRKKGWLMKCKNFFVNYYGIAPIEKIYEMYKQRVRASLDEMINTFLEMPLEYTESDIFTMEELREAMPELSKMGIPIDFNSNADTVPVMGFPNGIMGDAVVSEKKIYPNDPCTCGSGKKYKKCCGKK